MNLLFEWFDKSGIITVIIIVLLSLYFIAINWIFFYRLFFLQKWFKIERNTTENLLQNSSVDNKSSFLHNCKDFNQNRKNRLEACLEGALKESTYGLTFLSIVASTAPFIGLFGTVVGILESFATFKDGVSLTLIAPAISEALIATAVGIAVAIPAYTYHLILKRKAYEIISYLKMQVNLIKLDNE